MRQRPISALTAACAALFAGSPVAAGQRVIRIAKLPPRLQQPEPEAARRLGARLGFRYALDRPDQITPEVFLRAAQRARSLRAPRQSASPKGGAGGFALTRASWKPLGPNNIGGRVRSLVIDPGNPQKMWLGSPGGGVWQSSNGGASWAPLDDFMGNLAVTALALRVHRNASEPDVLYAGTGEGYTFGALPGAGIFKGILRPDGTASWSSLAAAATPQFRIVNRLAVSADGAVFLAATWSGIFRSADQGASFAPVFSGAQVGCVVFHPRDPQRAVASTRTGTLLYSTNGGQTWIRAEHPFSTHRVELTYARADPTLVYASVDDNEGEIWRSVDGGKSYTVRSTGTKFMGKQGFANNVIWAGDPTKPNFIIAAGSKLWQSEDGGAHLTRVPTVEVPKPRPHDDYHCIVADPRYNGIGMKTLYVCTDGGIFRAADVSRPAWEELNTGLAITQFYGVAGNATSRTIIGGTQDNGTLRLLAGGGPESFSVMLSGDGGHCAADGANPSNFYSEYTHLNIFRSTNGGASAEYISGAPNDKPIAKEAYKMRPFVIPDARDGKALFIAPFVLDPNNSNRILGGGLSLWRTDDALTPNTQTRGPMWEEMRTPIGEDVNMHAITAIAIAKSNSNIVWVGYPNGDLYRATNATSPPSGVSWVQVGGGSFPTPKRAVTSIAIDPTDPQRVFVTFGGFETGSVWRTTRDGAEYRWKDLSAGLPKAPARSVILHPNDPKLVYLGTEFGVFESVDGGEKWTAPHQGPNNSAVFGLAFVGQTLVAATYGRGLWAAEIPSGRPPPIVDFDVQVDAASATISDHPPNDPGGPAGALRRWVRARITPSGRGERVDVEKTRFQLSIDAPGANPPKTARPLRAGEVFETWIPVSSRLTCTSPSAPGCAALTVGERIVRACVGEIGKVENTPGPHGDKIGWRHLVAYHQETWKRRYNPAWEGPLKALNGFVSYPVSRGSGMTGWAPHFATWCVVQARPEVFWAGDGIGGLGALRTDLDKATCGDIVVNRGTNWGVVEKIDGTHYEVVTGYVGGVKEQRIARATWDRKDLALFYPTEPTGPRASMPLSRPAAPGVSPYQSTVTMTADFPPEVTPTTTQRTKTLVIPKPTVRIQPKVTPSAGGKRSVLLTIEAQGFAGQRDSWKRRVLRDGKPLCKTPYTFDLGVTESAKIDAVVSDEWEVETVVESTVVPRRH
jgi:photosystem II stability/assembly factor-like uncharacterized protein